MPAAQLAQQRAFESRPSGAATPGFLVGAFGLRVRDGRAVCVLGLLGERELSSADVGAISIRRRARIRSWRPRVGLGCPRRTRPHRRASRRRAAERAWRSVRAWRAGCRTGAAALRPRTPHPAPVAKRSPMPATVCRVLLPFIAFAVYALVLAEIWWPGFVSRLAPPAGGCVDAVERVFCVGPMREGYQCVQRVL
jgi:hypothetical protein